MSLINVTIQEVNMGIIEQLERLAHQHNMAVRVLEHGHIQITGGNLLVNYYPFSKNRTAYVGQTVKGIKGCTATEAIQMALSQPKITGSPAKRRAGKTRSRKKRLYRKTKNCHWCKQEFKLSELTLEHKIPLARGGLDNDNNLTLACEPCNTARGHNMVELRDAN